MAKAWLARHDERGMTTAEYAVGTVASVSIVGILIAIIQNPAFRELIMQLISLLFSLITRAMGG
ncbi:MAG: DUF4244 domain-containing protein [Propionibacteriaceae bacterium]|jgi:hypothetical protein|nr:DUF4244 domain-containing protein [Propionibacteriaceae bacterium]